MDDLFAPPAEAWQRLSPRYALVRRVSSLVFFGVVGLGGGLATWLFLQQWWAAVGVLIAAAALAAFQWWRLGRWVRAWGYAERAEDLYLTHGLWFKQLTVVPYGRLQLVKVESGPIERSQGLASVSLITASAHSGARIPGLPAAEAARLRDRLVEVGQAAGSGL